MLRLHMPEHEVRRCVGNCMIDANLLTQLFGLSVIIFMNIRLCKCLEFNKLHIVSFHKQYYLLFNVYMDGVVRQVNARVLGKGWNC